MHAAYSFSSRFFLPSPTLSFFLSFAPLLKSNTVLNHRTASCSLFSVRVRGCVSALMELQPPLPILLSSHSIIIPSGLVHGRLCKISKMQTHRPIHGFLRGQKRKHCSPAITFLWLLSSRDGQVIDRLGHVLFLCQRITNG